MRGGQAARTVGTLVGLALVAAACGGGPGGGQAEPTASCAPGAASCIGLIRQDATQVSLLAAQSQVVTGTSLLTFGLVTEDGQLLAGGAPEVWVARDERSEPLGPFRASFHRFHPDPESRAPRSPITGFYAARVEVPQPGRWMAAAVAEVGGRRLVGVLGFEATEGPVPAQVGTRAIPARTPVATTERELREVCTRPPPDPMHYISLDEALRNGKPTVVVFATPLLCESQLCGPVVDEVLAVYRKVGPERANFVHVEIYPPGKDLEPPPATEENASPAFKAWGFHTEPWVVVVDAKGTIRARFEGPVTADLIEEALQPLL
ncbi:MAG TPA: hypothetical protein VNO34_06775 [Actinomycetota bacterium]|nr:hypothetical protein [Actinomycetota bacterium]